MLSTCASCSIRLPLSMMEAMRSRVAMAKWWPQFVHTSRFLCTSLVSSAARHAGHLVKTPAECCASRTRARPVSCCAYTKRWVVFGHDPQFRLRAGICQPRATSVSRLFPLGHQLLRSRGVRPGPGRRSRRPAQPRGQRVLLCGHDRQPATFQAGPTRWCASPAFCRRPTENRWRA